MRKQKKWVSWVLLSVVMVLAVGALLAAFVPMQGNKGKFLSFFGAQNYSTSMSDQKMVVTYTYKTTHGSTSADVKSACNTIQSLLHQNGFVSATATALGSNKIEVEMARPARGTELSNALALLGGQGIGVGGLEIKTENKADADALLIGSKHVKNVSTVTSNGYYYTVVSFTDEAKALMNSVEAEAEAQSKSVSYYLFFGGSSEVTGGHAFTRSNNFVNGDLYIGGLESQAAADQYQLICKAGSLKVDLNSASIRDINYQNNNGAKTARIVLWVCVLLVVLAFLTIILVRHGVFAFISALVCNVFAVSLALLLSAVMPWIELSGSALVVFAISAAVFNVSVLTVFERMRSEMLFGKEFQMCVDSGYVRSFKPTLIIGVVMFLGGLFSAVAFGGAVQVCATLVSIFGVLSVACAIGLIKVVFQWLVNVGKVNMHTVRWGDKK